MPGFNSVCCRNDFAHNYDGATCPYSFVFYWGLAVQSYEVVIACNPYPASLGLEAAGWALRYTAHYTLADAYCDCI